MNLSSAIQGVRASTSSIMKRRRGEEEIGGFVASPRSTLEAWHVSPNTSPGCNPLHLTVQWECSSQLKIASFCCQALHSTHTHVHNRPDSDDEIIDCPPISYLPIPLHMIGGSGVTRVVGNGRVVGVPDQFGDESSYSRVQKPCTHL